MLDGRIALVTGAARGIGRAIASVFVEAGAKVAVADMDGDGAMDSAKQLGRRAQPYQCDVVDESSVVSTIEDIIDRNGRLDILVNNAGIARDAMLHRMTVSDFQAVVDVHLRGTWLCTKTALTHMRSRSGGGSIVNMSSIAGKVGNLGQSNYAAAKAGIIALTKTTAREGARYGIRANAIMPGLIRTGLTEAMPSSAWEEKLREIPLGRAGEPAEVANVALFLVSEMSSYVTGVTVEVAGGRHI